MKTLKKIFKSSLAFAIAFVSFQAVSSPMHTETTSFKVFGNCGMCKKRIETALLKNPNVKKASWDIETKMLTVEYDPHTINVDAIHKIVADAGHDTDKVKADDAAYKKLHTCCQYDRKK